MNKLAVLFFAAAVCVCVSAFPSSLPSGGYVRVVRAALPDPNPHYHIPHSQYRPHSYGGDYYSGYDNYDYGHGGYNQGYDGYNQGYGGYNQGYGGYGNNYYPYQNNGHSSSSNANSAAFNSPWGSGAFASANSASGPGSGIF